MVVELSDVNGGDGVVVGGRGPLWSVRFGVSVVVVAVFVAAILFGSRSGDGSGVVEQRVAVLVASEDWVVGEPPGRFELVEVDADVAVFLTAVGDVDDQVVVQPVRAGQLVGSDVLGGEVLVSERDSEVLLWVELDVSAGAGRGLAVGDRVVVSESLGGCAVAVVQVLGLDVEQVGRVVVSADPVLAGVLGGLEGGVGWREPVAGWPGCEALVGG